jgi:hypothetical protein
MATTATLPDDVSKVVARGAATRGAGRLMARVPPAAPLQAVKPSPAALHPHATITHRL